MGEHRSGVRHVALHPTASGAGSHQRGERLILPSMLEDRLQPMSAWPFPLHGEAGPGSDRWLDGGDGVGSPESGVLSRESGVRSRESDRLFGLSASARTMEP